MSDLVHVNCWLAQIVPETVSIFKMAKFFEDPVMKFAAIAESHIDT